MIFTHALRSKHRQRRVATRVVRNERKVKLIFCITDRQTIFIWVCHAALHPEPGKGPLPGIKFSREHHSLRPCDQPITHEAFPTLIQIAHPA